MAEHFFGITDTGKLRDNNEDTFIAEAVSGGRFIIACAIDGVGGYVGGEVAAAIAKDAIPRHLKEPSGDIISLLKEAFSIANERIQEEKLQVSQYSKMACVLTLALVDMENNLFYYAHVGDTRLYLLRDQSLVKVTKDHSFVGFLEDSGRLSEELAMKHPKRNEINKALGFGEQIHLQKDYIETGQSPFLPGDILLLCSDGLTDLVNKQDITAILGSRTSLEAKGKELIAAANNNGGKDNITVVLVQNAKRPARQTNKPIKPKKPGRKVTPAGNVTSGVPATPVVETKEIRPVVAETKKEKNYKPLAIILAALCLVFLAIVIYLLSGSSGKEGENRNTPNSGSSDEFQIDAVPADSMILVDTTKQIEPSINR